MVVLLWMATGLHGVRISSFGYAEPTGINAEFAMNDAARLYNGTQFRSDCHDAHERSYKVTWT